MGKTELRICECCKRNVARNGPAPYCWDCFFCETCDLQTGKCGVLTPAPKSV